MIYCPQCGTQNKPNSKFCKNCAALLQPSTDIRCPICGTLNPQAAESCKSCGTRLSTSAGTRSSDQATPANTPEDITPFNPPELQEPDAPAEKPSAASVRAAFSPSGSQWLRRIGKTPPESKPPEAPSSPSNADVPRAPETPASDDWIQQLDAANQAASQLSSAAPVEPAPAKPQLSEIKLTGDDYDYSDIGGEVTDEMKAQLEAEAGSVQSVEDEVALAMRLLGLSPTGEPLTETQPEAAVASVPIEPVAQLETAAAESIAEIETPAPIEPVAEIETPAPIESVAQIETVAPEAVAEIETPAPEAVVEIETPAPIETAAAAVVASEMFAPTETPAPAKPQLSEIKLTGDDYDYSDIGGEVTDEMKAQLEAEAGSVQSVEDEVALAMRLLGLSAGAAAVSAVSQPETAALPPSPTTEPVAQEPSAPEAVAAEAIVQEPTAQEPIAAEAIVQEPTAQEPAAAEAIALVLSEPVAEIETPALAAAPLAESAVEEQENPEWLARLAAASSAAVAAKMVSDARSESAEPEAEQILTEQLAQAPVESSEPTSPAEVVVAAAMGDADNLPEWLRELAPPEVLEADAAKTEEGMPEWVRDLAPGAAVVGTSALLSHLPDLDESERKELPDWLREPLTPPEVESKSEAMAEAEQLEAAPEPERQVPVELPAWMRAGAAAGRDPFEVVETTGPLAGVSGILPLAVALSEPHTLATATPPRTDSGRIFQTLLAEPLAAATTPPPAARAARRFTTQHLLYLLLFLAAVLALFLPSGADELGLLGKDVIASPSAVFYDQLNTLPASSAVLVAFEYVPGQAPELEPAARAILENLAARKVNVIALSSNPNGAIMAQTLMQETKQAHPAWAYVNLGFIPGNEVGLKNLALGWLPSNYVDANGAPWAQSPLAKSVRGMDDLALSVLILGDPNGLNGWMTQVQPIVKSPMIAATTAALEPQARIYVNSKQLNASLRGLTGAAELELWSGNSGRAVKTVNALSFVSLVLAGIIIATNVIWLLRRNKK